MSFGGLCAAGGPPGYLSREESRHDIVENPCASTALSCTGGPATAHALAEDGDRAVVTVSGDGALIAEYLDPMAVAMNTPPGTTRPPSGSSGARQARRCRRLPALLQHGPPRRDRTRRCAGQ
ncbi:1-deoxy-D-xylulose-5-phosphate synthase N-terminal domain-containing protein [Streptomyces syringium]